MTDELARARDNLIQEMGRLSSFAGFNKAMGQIYGFLYLSPEPVSLGEIAEQLGISKGNASLNIKTMERWGLIQPSSKRGDRRDYYRAETDFWKIVQDIITERDKKEIDHILISITGIFESVKTVKSTPENTESLFYQERLGNMVDFGNAASQMIQAVITMSNVRNNISIHSGQEKGNSRRINIEE